MAARRPASRGSCGGGPPRVWGGGPRGGAGDLGHGGGANHPVVAVGVAGNDGAELVLCEFGCLAVMAGDLLGGGVAGQRAELQQRPGRGRAVQVAVGDDRAVVGSLRPAVVRVQTSDAFKLSSAVEKVAYCDRL